MRRRARLVIAGATVVVLLAPVALDRDSLPLSTYPMYASARSETVALVTANAVDADGRRRRLDPATIGSSADPLVVAGELRAAVRSGGADRRCGEIARRVGARTAERGTVGVEVVTEVHDVVARTLDDDSLLRREVHATCDVVVR
ncbi:hypothetical protein [Ilumatobacter sp.]|uniref:hypothetical protein n=1 Tax=Ilumatobacter sp. TaxID=1967498 RepID=UPI003B52E744